MKTSLRWLVVLMSWTLLLSAAEARLSYDLGYSFGESGDEDYSELNLGLNYHFTDYLIWRNSGFHRNFSNDALDDRYGLDTSVQLNWTLRPEGGGRFNIYGGPGWRFDSEGDNPPFAEGGVGIQLAGLRVSAGAKVIFNEVIDEDRENDTQYTVSISASGDIGGR